MRPALEKQTWQLVSHKALRKLHEGQVSLQIQALRHHRWGFKQKSWRRILRGRCLESGSGAGHGNS